VPGHWQVISALGNSKEALPRKWQEKNMVYMLTFGGVFQFRIARVNTQVAQSNI
jgi:hypothetical protein